MYQFLGDVERAIWWIDRYLESFNTSSVGFGAWKLKLQGDDEAREKFVLEALERNPQRGQSILSLSYHITDLYIASGQLEELRSGWERFYPSFFEPRVQITWRDRWDAKDLARV